MARRKTEQRQTDTNLPEYLQDTEGAATVDNFDTTDTLIPRIVLLQGLSDIVTEHDAAEPGIFWHTGLDLPIDPLTFVTVFRRKRYALIAPRLDGRGVIARADDGKTWDRLGEWEVKISKKETVTWSIKDLNVEQSGMARWGTFDPSDDNSPPAAAMFYDYIALLTEHLDYGPVMMSFTRSALRQVRRGLNNKLALQLQRNVPIQAVEFEAKAFKDSNSAGDEFYNWQFIQKGFVDKEVYQQAITASKSAMDYQVPQGGDGRPALGYESDI